MVIVTNLDTSSLDINLAEAIEIVKVNNCSLSSFYISSGIYVTLIIDYFSIRRTFFFCLFVVVRDF